MPNLFHVVLDACVMLPQNLNNFLLTLAEEGLFSPVWTFELLDEVKRNLIGKLELTPFQAAHRIDQMTRAFPLASFHAEGYEALISSMTNDFKDRHVLAAAVRSRASVIVTSNLKDFSAAALGPYGIDAVHPDDFLLDQLDLDQAGVVACMRRVAERNKRPPRTLWELREALRPLTPQFSAAVEAVTDDAASRRL